MYSESAREKTKKCNTLRLKTVALTLISDSGGILTRDLRNRNPTLYTAKLRSHFLCSPQNGRSSVDDGASKGAASIGGTGAA